MVGRRKAAVLAVAAVVSAGAGVAWAQHGPNAGPERAAPAGGTRALGGGTTESSYVPVTACRLVDTRLAGGKLVAGAGRTFDVRGGGGTFAAQGGRTGGCAIPQAASAVEITVIAVESGSGYLRAYPAGQSAPAATFLHFSSALKASTTGSVPLCGFNGSDSCLANRDLSVRAFNGATHLVIDVQGYFVPPMAATVAGNGSVIRSSRVVGATRIGTGSYVVTFDRDVSACTFTGVVGQPTAGVSRGMIDVQPSAASTSAVYVETLNPSGAVTDLPFHLGAVC